jgi:hypothetical protein
VKTLQTNIILPAVVDEVDLESDSELPADKDEFMSANGDNEDDVVENTLTQELTLTEVIAPGLKEEELEHQEEAPKLEEVEIEQETFLPVLAESKIEPETEEEVPKIEGAMTSLGLSDKSEEALAPLSLGQKALEEKAEANKIELEHDEAEETADNKHLDIERNNDRRPRKSALFRSKRLLSLQSRNVYDFSFLCSTFIIPLYLGRCWNRFYFQWQGQKLLHGWVHLCILASLHSAEGFDGDGPLGSAYRTPSTLVSFFHMHT